MAITHAPIRPPRNMIEEQVYARRWAELMGSPSGYDDRNYLEAVLIHYDTRVGQREASVAASFICWLGTNIGKSFLSEGRRLTPHFQVPQDAYHAAWSVHNRRRFASNNGWRSVEYFCRTEEDQKANVMPRPSANDYEVVEHVAEWLGSAEGQDFIAGCETEIERHRKLDFIARHNEQGLGHLPIVQQYKAELASI